MIKQVEKKDTYLVFLNKMNIFRRKIKRIIEHLSIILLRQLEKEAPRLLWRLEISTLIGEKEKKKEKESPSRNTI